MELLILPKYWILEIHFQYPQYEVMKSWVYQSSIELYKTESSMIRRIGKAMYLSTALATLTFSKIFIIEYIIGKDKEHLRLTYSQS